jgi:hypothetical protein
MIERIGGIAIMIGLQPRTAAFLIVRAQAHHDPIRLRESDRRRAVYQPLTATESIARKCSSRVATVRHPFLRPRHRDAAPGPKRCPIFMGARREGSGNRSLARWE